MSDEMATGAAAELSQAGYSSMPDAGAPEADQTEFKTPREAVASRAVTVPATVPVQYQTPSGERVDGSEAVTAERAARDLTTYRVSQAAQTARSVSADFALEVDAARAAHAGIENAAAAAKMGISAAEDAGIDAPESLAVAVMAEEAATGLEPSLEAALRHPQVRAAVEEELGKAAQTQQAYATGLANANAFSQAALIELAPELAALPLDQFAQGLQMLQQVNPQRYQSVLNLLDRVGRLQAQQQHEHQQRQVQLDAYMKAEDAKFDRMISVTPAQKQEIGNEMFAYASEMGIERGQLIHLFQTEPLLRHSAFQRLIYDAIQARISRKAPKPVPTRAIPPVQRPGTSVPRGEREAANLHTLSNRLTTSGSLADAAALLLARRGRR
jgi:hypothetical protein